jgi:hypothetical protein
MKVNHFHWLPYRLITVGKIGRDPMDDVQGKNATRAKFDKTVRSLHTVIGEVRDQLLPPQTFPVLNENDFAGSVKIVIAEIEKIVEDRNGKYFPDNDKQGIGGLIRNLANGIKTICQVTAPVLQVFFTITSQCSLVTTSLRALTNIFRYHF